MELVSTMEISGEEREIADAYARGQIEGINSNLSDLKYGDVAGGKNLFDGEFINKVIDIGGNYTQRNLKEEFVSIRNVKGLTYITFGGYFKKGTYTFSYTNDAWFSLNRIAIAGTYCIGITQTIRKSYTWTQNIDGWTYFGIEGDDGETGTVDTPFSITPDIMIEQGSTATTPYEPYIPSVKMLAEEVNQQNESLSVIGKCKNLLNPTLQTTTENGVTCTANGDGTYTLNGTSTYVTYFRLSSQTFDLSKTYKIVGCPKGGAGKCSIYDDRNIIIVGDSDNSDGGNGGMPYNPSVNPILYISIRANVELNNLVLKPMLTTDLNATYDDYVPYTGDGETLTHDVAELKNDLGGLSFSVSGTILTITNGENTWTLNANS